MKSCKLEGEKKKKDELFSMLLPPIIGICICAVCLAGGTFAWFTASQDVSTQAIVAAEYSVESTVINAEVHIEAQNGAYTLEAGKEYTVTLKATGTASTGYCVVKLNGEIYKPTVQFPTTESADKEISFTLAMNEKAILTIGPQWGSAAWKNTKIKDGGSYVYGEEGTEQTDPPVEDTDTSDTTDTPDVTEEPDTTDAPETTEPPSDTKTDETKLDPEKYTVKSGDTLDKIARLYNTTVKRLAAYNNIEDLSLIYAGQVIKIPPADWKIPESTTPPETKPAETEPTGTTTETGEPS